MITQKKGLTLGEQSSAPDSAEGQKGLSLNRKKLLFRFIGLPHHSKVAIMKKFGLWQESDQKLPDAEIFAACFERAKNKGVLDKVWDAVEAQGGQQS